MQQDSGLNIEYCFLFSRLVLWTLNIIILTWSSNSWFLNWVGITAHWHNVMWFLKKQYYAIVRARLFYIKLLSSWILKKIPNYSSTKSVLLHGSVVPMLTGLSLSMGQAFSCRDPSQIFSSLFTPPLPLSGTWVCDLQANKEIQSHWWWRKRKAIVQEELSESE